MGGSLHIIAVGGPTGLTVAAARLVSDLERRWTRFSPGSELSRLNAHAGAPVFVSPATAHLVERLRWAWESTSGAFDPTASVTALGYDRELTEMCRRAVDVRPTDWPGGAGRGVGCDGVEVDVASGYVLLPPDVQLDPGGLGKGLAADLVAESMFAAGAAGAVVNLGGDLRVVGNPRPANGSPTGWRVGIEDPHDPSRCVAVIPLPSGAVATSSVLRRRWRTSGGWCHHLLDPRTGLPVAAEFDTITVVTREAWWAEAMTKALMVTPFEQWPRVLCDEQVVAVRPDGSVLRIDRPAEVDGPELATGASPA